MSIPGDYPFQRPRSQHGGRKFDLATPIREKPIQTKSLQMVFKAGQVAFGPLDRSFVRFGMELLYIQARQKAEAVR